jgi:hypothetical protein
MLGLTALEHKVKPETTLEKIFFLVEFGFTSAHRPTFVVSACALGTLVILRLLKATLRQFKWVARVPEVLIVVIVSTRAFLFLVSPSTSLASAVLSDGLRWDDDGIDILGKVPIHTGGHFIKFPLHHHHLRYMKETTSTAV